jgi:hypothetical protein
MTPTDVRTSIPGKDVAMRRQAGKHADCMKHFPSAKHGMRTCGLPRSRHAIRGSVDGIQIQ